MIFFKCLSIFEEMNNKIHHKYLIFFLGFTGWMMIISLMPKLASSQAKEGFEAYTESIPGSDQKIKMVPIKGGTFMMGSPANDPGRKETEGPAQKVKVDDFWMGAYEITWDQYEVFMHDMQISDNSYDPALQGVDAITRPTPEYIDVSLGLGRHGGYPVVNVTNYAAMMFAKWLYKKTGHFYRLPTEAEWEYAARAGSATPYYFGDNASELDQYAWFKENSNEKYQKVGLKKPNAFGLYDMLGNVAEWTADEYKKDYFDELDKPVAVNPWFRPTQLYPRSVRGGSWADDPDNLRVAARRGSSPRWKRDDPQVPKSFWWLTSAPFVGFRLIRPKVKPSVDEIRKYWIEKMEDY